MSIGKRVLVHNLRSTLQSARLWAVAHWRVIAFALITVLFLANSFTYFGWGHDDPGILFRYAVNFAEGRGLVHDPTERVEGFSAFGYVILMSIAYKSLGLSGRPEVLFIVSKFVGLGCSVPALWLTYRIGVRFLRLETKWALFACLMLASSGPFAIWSVGALETTCLLCLLLVSLYFYLSYVKQRVESPTGKNTVGASFLCGIALSFLILLRADALVFVAIIGAHWLFSRIRSREIHRLDWPVVVLPLVTASGYEVWRLWYYGYPLPNSYYAKIEPSLSLYHVVATFRNYMEPYLYSLGGTGLIVGLAAISAYKDREYASRFLAFFCASYVAYVVIVGGDWMAAYRFLVPVVPLLLLLIVNGARYVVQSAGFRFRRTTAGAMVSFCIAGLLAVQQIHQGMGMVGHTREVLHGTNEDFSPWYEHPTLDARRLVPYWDISMWVLEHADDSALLATHQAGFIPLLTGLRTIDTLGITNAVLAHMPNDPVAVRKGRAGFWHWIGQEAAATPAARYILEQRPDLYIIYSRWNKESTNTAEYLAGGEYVLLESDLHGFDVYVPSGGTEKVLVNLASFGNASTSFSSNYDPSGTAGNVFHGGTWTSGCNDEAWVQSSFEEPYLVERITVDTAGTDITTDDSLIEFMLLDPDGSSVTVASLTEKNINWDSASDGAVLNSVPEYRLKLPEPRLATGFRLHLRGHGWFLASDIQVLGRAAPSK